MWRFIPLFLVHLLKTLGLFIFRDMPEETREGVGVKAAGIFRTSVMLLLYRLKLYPKSLRKLGKYMQVIIEVNRKWLVVLRVMSFFQFFLSLFVVEHLEADFWVPLDKTLKLTLAKVAQVAEDTLRPMGEECSQYCQYLSNEWAGVIASYVVSLFFLASVLHGTRMIDFRESR